MHRLSTIPPFQREVEETSGDSIIIYVFRATTDAMIAFFVVVVVAVVVAAVAVGVESCFRR